VSVPAPAAVAEAFRALQAGDLDAALEHARRALAADPGNARAYLAAGVALRLAKRHAEAREALERAQHLDPRDHGAPYEAGLLAQQEGRLDAALEHFERSARARPEFVAAPFAAGIVHAGRKDWPPAAVCFRRVLEIRPGEPLAMLHLALVLASAGEHDAAQAAFQDAMARHPRDAGIVRAHGQYRASRGDFAQAAESFARVLRLDPSDAGLPLFLAQCELLCGRWARGWAAYAAREPRRALERSALARGAPYSVPALDGMRGVAITIMGEQGLGDTLFFLRWAPVLREAGARLAFAGDERLHGLLGRTGLFEAIAKDAGEGDRVVLAGDLPAMLPAIDPFSVPSLRIAPLPERVATWTQALESAGARPWIGIQWRAGTPRDVQATALSKVAPLEPLFGALASSRGTLLAIQRAPAPGEIERAGRAARRTVSDFSRANDDLEDALAVASLLDRHVAVSNTNLHLAAAADATADVLVPFPPEWRWRAQGTSPWFPGFRVHRQGLDGDWTEALAGLARAIQASGLQ
jgi:tetratricopeptide (TPR) repeat protein